MELSYVLSGMIGAATFAPFIYFPMRKKMKLQRLAERDAYDALVKANDSMSKLKAAADEAVDEIMNESSARISGLEDVIEGLRENLFSAGTLTKSLNKQIADQAGYIQTLHRVISDAANSKTHEELRDALKLPLAPTKPETVKEG